MDFGIALSLHHLNKNFNRDELEAVHQFEKTLILSRLQKASSEAEKNAFSEKLLQLKAGHALLAEHLDNQEAELIGQSENIYQSEQTKNKIKYLGLGVVSMAVLSIGAILAIHTNNNHNHLRAQQAASLTPATAQVSPTEEVIINEAELARQEAKKLAAHKAFSLARTEFKAARNAWKELDLKDKRLPVPIAKLQADIDLAVHGADKSHAISLINTYIEEVDNHINKIRYFGSYLETASTQVNQWDRMRQEIGFQNIDPQSDIELLESVSEAIRTGKMIPVDETALTSIASKYEVLNQKASQIIDLANQYAEYKVELSTLNQDILDIATTPSTQSLVESAESAPRTKEDLDALVDKVYPRLLNFLSNKVETLQQRTTS